MQNQEWWNRLHYDNPHCEMPRTDPLWRSQLSEEQLNVLFARIKAKDEKTRERREGMAPKEWLKDWGKEARKNDQW